MNVDLTSTETTTPPLETTSYTMDIDDFGDCCGRYWPLATIPDSSSLKHECHLSGNDDDDDDASDTTTRRRSTTDASDSDDDDDDSDDDDDRRQRCSIRIVDVDSTQPVVQDQTTIDYVDPTS